MKVPICCSVLLLFVTVLSTKAALAQEKESEELKINLQLRPRAELRNGLFTPILEGQKPASFVAQRSRLGLTYSKNQKLKVGLSTQVVTTWGNDPQVQLTANDVSLYEAWAQFYFTHEWNLKIGRQVFSYDDERILGSLDWNNAARKHDAALLGFEKNKFRADLAFAFNQNAEKITNTFYNDSLSQPYKSMQFLWMKYQLSNAWAFSVLAINLDMQNRRDSSISYLQNIGGNIFYKKSHWNVTGTYFYQSGKKPAKDAAFIKTNAWMAAAKADYSFNKKFTAGIGTDYLSGRKMNSSLSKITDFNPLFGTHHKFYGYMDYFYVSSPHKNVGLSDSYINLNFKPAEKLAWQIALHHFEATAKVVDYNGDPASATLGNEADLTFNYQVMSEVKFSGGYSQMFNNTSMKYVKSIAPAQSMKGIQNWIWLSVNCNPDILIIKRKP